MFYGICLSLANILNYILRYKQLYYKGNNKKFHDENNLFCFGANDDNLIPIYFYSFIQTELEILQWGVKTNISKMHHYREFTNLQSGYLFYLLEIQVEV